MPEARSEPAAWQAAQITALRPGNFSSAKPIKSSPSSWVACQLWDQLKLDEFWRERLPEFVRSADLMVRVVKPCSGAPLGRTWQHRRKNQTPLHVELTAIDLKYGNC